MTHKELFEQHPTPGFDTPACAGALELMWSRSESVFFHGAFRPHAVELYRCTECDTRLPLDASTGQVLNAYQPPPVTQLARELARAFDADREV